MLLGRERECAAVDRLLRSARAGEGGALLVRGDAGIGKTALLARARAHAAPMRVVEARGVESEAELPFAGLATIVRPLLRYLDALPEPQREGVAAALALRNGSPPDRFAVALGTLGVLAAAAADEPLLVIVDDAHWLDVASRHAILFSARRVAAEPIAFILASRDNEPRSLAWEAVDEIRLGGLADADAYELLASADVHRDVAAAIVRAAAGNPLALLEIPRALTREQRSGTNTLAEPLPAAGSIGRAFEARAERLPEETRRALLVVAAEPSAERRVIDAALSVLRVQPQALAPAEAEGLVAVDARGVELRHPLVRSALYHAADAAARRAAHRALAEALVAPADADRRAWHLAAAASGPDEQAAATLEAAADRASRRSGHASAAAALDRAAQLTPAPDEAARRYVAAARAAFVAAMPARAEAALKAAARLSADPLLAADVAHLRGTVAAAKAPLAAAAQLAEDADVVLPYDAARASRMLRDAALAAASADDWGKALSLGARSVDAASRAGASDRIAELILAAVRSRRAEGPLAPEAVATLHELSHDLGAAPALLLVANYLDEGEAAIAVARAILREARLRGAVGVVPRALLTLGMSAFYDGRWDQAVSELEEAYELAREAQLPLVAAEAQILLARIAAFRGRADECRTRAADAEQIAAISGAPKTASYLGVVLGELELGLGNVDAAIAKLEPAVAEMLPAVARAQIDLAECYVAAGRRDDARAIAADLERGGATSGRVGARDVVLGLLADDATFADHFRDALVHEVLPPDRARKQLLFGERLRRAGRRTEAREQLRAALETYERLRAEPWATRARQELAATGERVRARAEAKTDELTPAELRVAQAVAEGATNKEAAARLFVTPNTIEFHLKNVFRKLGVRSRTELARRFAAGAS